MWYRQEGDKLTLDIYVQPGAKTTEIAGLHGEALKIRLNSPPIDGRANQALIEFLAKRFDVPKRQIELLRGEKSRHKTVVVIGSHVDLKEIIL